MEEGQPWPFGQWAHGARGVFQFYRELLHTSDLGVMTTYLDYLAAKKVKGHWPCPCRKGKKLRDCHFEQIKELRGKISRKDAERSLNILKRAGTSAIEMAEATAEPSILTIQGKSEASSQNPRWRFQQPNARRTRARSATAYVAEFSAGAHQR